MTRGVRNSLGRLRDIPGVERVHIRSDGVTVVMFTDGTAMRIPNLTPYQAMNEAHRLERRAKVIRALAADRTEWR